MTIDEFLTNIKGVLDKLTDEDKKWLASTESGGQAHFSLGMWIRNNWRLWEKTSPLVDFFKQYGIWHADDMSGIILCSYVRMLRNEEVKFEEQVQKYKDYWTEHGNPQIGV
jgi:hypothetical protein